MATTQQPERKMMFGQLKSVDAEQGIITGYPVTWDRDREGDQIMPGAYTESFPAYMAAGAPVLFNHDQSEPVGKTLVLREDERGVYFEAQLLPPGTTPLVDNVRTWLKQKVMRALSHSFLAHLWEPIEANDSYGARGRRILKGLFIEPSLVLLPANPSALITGYKNLCAATAAAPTMVSPLVNELSLTLAATLKRVRYLEGQLQRQGVELALARTGFESVAQLRQAKNFVDHVALANMGRAR